MIYRLRNILNWVAFVSLGCTASVFVLSVVQAISELSFIMGNDPPVIWAEFTLVLYPLWVLIQYIIWKKPVFIPWHFKDDEEWD